MTASKRAKRVSTALGVLTLVLLYGSAVADGILTVALLAATFLLLILITLLTRAGKLPDNAEERAEHERDMQRRPGESWWRVWVRRFFAQI